ncbi:hypothetical protein ACP70R_027013 [Stipagrostis hirtigluma subsp. patula]
MRGLTQAYPAGSMFGIIIRQTLKLDQRLEQFIKDMEKDDALVAVVQGRRLPVGAGPWPGNAATTIQ